MQLVILILAACVLGYFLAKSRFSKSIDEAGEKFSQGTRDLATKSESWVKEKFSKKGSAKTDNEEYSSEEVVVDIAEDANEETVEEIKTAQKRPSRRAKDTEQDSKEND
jgi:Ni/Co efflux regulator RcnB